MKLIKSIVIIFVFLTIPIKASSNELLIWYDTNARRMPWRVCPTKIKAGVKPDPYKVWLSEIMLQQTTVATVKSYFINFVSTWPTISDLAKAICFKFLIVSRSFFKFASVNVGL